MQQCERWRCQSSSPNIVLEVLNDDDTADAVATRRRDVGGRAQSCGVHIQDSGSATSGFSDCYGDASQHGRCFDHEDHNSADRRGNDYGEQVSGAVHVGSSDGVCLGQLHGRRARGAR